MNLYAVYEITERMYIVRCYDYDGSVVVDAQMGYNTYIALPNYHYRDSSGLDLYERWGFRGWSTTNYADSNPANPVYVNVSNLLVTTDIILYAHYVKEDVREIATSNEYLSFKLKEGAEAIYIQNHNMVLGPSGTTQIHDKTAYEGYEVSINQGYRELLQGKVTLPETYNGKPVISVGDFQVCNNITHVFFQHENTCQYVRIAPDAFNFNGNEQYTKLVGFYAPPSLLSIGENAFYYAIKLEDFRWNNNIVEIGRQAFASDPSRQAHAIKVNELPENLITLGANAFYSTTKNVVITKIPSKLEEIGNWAFYCKDSDDGIGITEFGGALKTIGDYAFATVGASIKENTIHIRRSVEKIGKQSFSNGATSHYGKGKVEHILIERPEADYGGPGAVLFDPKAQVSWGDSDITKEIA
jgi:hypothetical protein